MQQHITINVAGDLIAGRFDEQAPIPFPGKMLELQSNLNASGFVKILADGTHLSGGSERTDHVAIMDQTTGLMWSVESLGDPADADNGISQEACVERCRNLTLLGFNDWRLPTRTELAGLVDDTRHEPAIDVDLFPRVKSRRHWTSTAAAWSPASAWHVSFSLGDVYDIHRSSYGFALAVRRAGQ